MGQGGLQEGGPAQHWVVILGTNPAAPVTMTIYTNLPKKLTVTPPVLHFDEHNWNTAHEISVTPGDNNEQDGDMVVILTFMSVRLRDPLTANDVSVQYRNITLVDDEHLGVR